MVESRVLNRATAAAVSARSWLGYGSRYVGAATSGDDRFTLRCEIARREGMGGMDAPKDLARRLQVRRAFRVARVSVAADLVVRQALLEGHVELCRARQRPAPHAERATLAACEP